MYDELSNKIFKMDWLNSEEEYKKVRAEQIEQLKWFYYCVLDEHLKISNETPNLKSAKPLFNLSETNWEEVAESRMVELLGTESDDSALIELITETETFRFATINNFSVVLGKPKSRKSTFISLLLAELLKRNN